MIEVIDQGSGIPPELKSRIFDPYFSTRDRYNHRGLGLSLARAWHVVHQNGGRITVTTDGTPSTNFTIRLPRAGARKEDSE